MDKIDVHDIKITKFEITVYENTHTFILADHNSWQNFLKEGT